MLGCEVEAFIGKVESADVLVKTTVVGVMPFVRLTKLLENPRVGFVVFPYVIEVLKEVIRLIDML